MLTMPITAIILAGGKSSRMGGCDKGLLLLKHKPLYCHVIDRIKHQVNDIIINTNRNIELYLQSNYCVVTDEINGSLGPLAGIHSGLINSQTDWNLIVTCDTPFLPNNLVYQLQKNRGNSLAAYAFDGEKAHPTILLIHRLLADKISTYLMQGDRKLLIFLQEINATCVNFCHDKHSFININTPKELDYWNRL